MGLVFAVFSMGGLAAFIWGVVADSPGLIISGLAATIYFAREGLQIWSWRLVLDDVGVTWRIRLWDPGRLRWQEIADVQTLSRYTAVGGGVTSTRPN